MAVAALTIATMAVVTASCVGEKSGSDDEVIDDPAKLDDLHLDLPNLAPTTWVRIHRPRRTVPGYNLVMYRRRIPLIIDMNGRIVHSWPFVRAVGRARLDRDGRLVVIGMDNLIKEYDWEGRLTWHYRLPGEKQFPHHDVIELRNGKYLVLARDTKADTDFLNEVDRDGQVVWEWRSEEHRESFPSWNPDRKDPTHINSLFELGANQWYDAGDERFRPGNLLVSARHLDTIFIIDRTTGKVVWTYSQGLDYQHEALMIPAGDFGEGLILLFNNGCNDLYDYRRSKVQAIHPLTGEVVWEYASEYFFSSVAGTAQKLPGKNVLITSSHGGRVLEVDVRGEIVWEWVPPWLPMRVERLAYDHCPQLAALEVPEATPVMPRDRRPYIDMELYSFSLIEEHVFREVDGVRRRLLPVIEGCREILVPPGARLTATFGLVDERLRGREAKARFTIDFANAGKSTTILDRVVTSEDEQRWQVAYVPLNRWTFQRVDMCLAVDVEGSMKNPDKMVAWGNPIIVSKVQRPSRERPEHRITEQEKKLRQQQLEALGYVN